VQGAFLDGETVDFTIRNLSNQAKLYSFGMKPSFKEVGDSPWAPIPGPVSFDKAARPLPLDLPDHVEGSDNYELSFSFRFSSENDFRRTYFAYCEPHSYSDCQAYLNELERRFSHHSQIYFTRELLTHSLDGRRIDLLTLTTYKDLLFERESHIEGLFPETKARPYKAKKPIIFISARVHPGEVPGSHILNGLLDFLTPAKAGTSSIR
jgi:hypothetical protein